MRDASPSVSATPDTGGNSGNIAGNLTWRALLVALALAAVTLFLVCYHDGNLVRRNVISHNYATPAALGVMFIFLLTLNALVHRLRRAWALRGGELAVVLALLVASFPLARYYAHNWVGTVGYTRALVEARSPALREVVNTNIYLALPDEALLDLPASQQFDQDLPAADGTPHEPNHFVNPARVPWGVWLKPMLFWAPLMLSFLLFSVSFGFIIYRQWAHRELAPFPLAQFAADLVRKRDDRAWPDVFYQPLFWMGFGLIAFIFGCNGLHALYEKMIEVPTGYSYYSLSNTFEFLKYSQEGYSLLRGTLYFTIIAAAVLLPSEISFTAWFTWPVMITATYFYYVQTGERFQHHHASMTATGAWWAMALLMIYTGRSFYLALLKRALGLPSKESVDSLSLWMGRLFLLSAACFLLVLWRLGVPGDLAVLYLIATLVTFLVLSRLVVEMGIIWTPLSGGGSSPLLFLLTVLGQSTVGVKAFALLSIIRSLTLPVNISALVLPPAVANALAAEHRLTRRNAAAPAVLPFLLVMLALACGTLIWLGYSYQSERDDLHARFGLNDLQQDARQIGALVGSSKLDAPGLRQALTTATPFAERWAQFEPAQNFGSFFLVGFLLVTATGFLRLKLPRFPLHPLPFVLFGSWLMSRYWLSFFIGWLIKTALLKIGGGKLFERSRPFFTGIVVGQAVVATLAALLTILMFWKNGFHLETTWQQFMTSFYSN